MAGNGFWLAVFVILSNTGTEDQGTDESGYATDHMNSGRTGEIMKTELGKPAAAPDPVTGNRINHQTDDQAVNTIRKKFGTFCHGTGNDGGSSCTEDGLENEKSPERNAVRCHGCSIIGFRGDTADLTEEAVAGSEHDTETDEPEDRGSDTEIHEVFHDDVAGIFCTGEAGLYHGKTGLHEEDQSGTYKDPDCVYC